MPSTPDILQNFRKHVFFHGTRAPADVVLREGFQRGWYDEEANWWLSSGIIGNGVYCSCSWRTALWFAPTLLRVNLKPGTRILNAAIPPDTHVLGYLRREFGRDILQHPPWRVLPRNKKLTLAEVIALIRYHYQHSYAWTTPTGPRGSRREAEHAKLLGSLRSMLVRYGFDGYGDPANDIGIVVFSPDRLSPRKVVVNLSEDDWDKHAGDDFAAFADLGALERWSWKRDQES
jgi:hypothetical protein